MSRDKRPSDGSRYSVGVGNIIAGGKVVNSPMTNVGSYAAKEQPPWLPQLQAELTRIRDLLEEGGDPAIPADDLDDAIEAVRALESDAESGQAGAKGFRRRVRALIGILAPVAEIIGGVAALEEILKHL